MRRGYRRHTAQDASCEADEVETDEIPDRDPRTFLRLRQNSDQLELTISYVRAEGPQGRTVEDDDDEQGDKLVTQGQRQTDDDRVEDDAKFQNGDGDQLGDPLRGGDVVVGPGSIRIKTVRRSETSFGHLGFTTRSDVDTGNTLLGRADRGD